MLHSFRFAPAEAAHADSLNDARRGCAKHRRAENHQEQVRSLSCPRRIVARLRPSQQHPELSRLAEDLKEEFFVVPVSAARNLNLDDLNFVDVTLASPGRLQPATDRTSLVLARGVVADQLASAG